MKMSLFKLQDYGVLTFKSTTHALKAERVLKDASADFLIMPTPRGISTSCGLAVKINSADLNPCYEILRQHQVEVDGEYLVKMIEGKSCIERVNNG